MNILVNEKSQAQCPKCGQWNKLEEHEFIHKFSCCRETIVVAIDKENLEKMKHQG